jgi:hypothetical protein
MIPHYRPSCRSTIQADHSCVSRRFDRVRRKPLAIFDIVDLYMLKFAYSGGIEERAIDSTRALVIQVGFGDANSM